MCFVVCRGISRCCVSASLSWLEWTLLYTGSSLTRASTNSLLDSRKLSKSCITCGTRPIRGMVLASSSQYSFWWILVRCFWSWFKTLSKKKLFQSHTQNLLKSICIRISCTIDWKYRTNALLRVLYQKSGHFQGRQEARWDQFSRARTRKI